MPHVLRAIRAIMPHMPRELHTSCLTCSRASRALFPASCCASHKARALRAPVSGILRAVVPHLTCNLGPLVPLALHLL